MARVTKIGMVCVNKDEETEILFSEKDRNVLCFDDYPVTNRGGKGVKPLTSRKRPGAHCCKVNDNDDLMIITEAVLP